MPPDPDLLWPTGPGLGDIGPGEVHVWAASLDVSHARGEELKRALSADEHERAARFRKPRDAFRWSIARGLLREILGQYCGVDPGLLRFAYGAHGKPALAEPTPGNRTEFNLSHSGSLAVYAFSRSFSIGIDVEQVVRIPDALDVAGRFFSEAERDALAAVPSAELLPSFYRCWTCKEAYLKARGSGLLVPLDCFDVEFMPGRAPRLLRVRCDATDPSRWSLFHLRPATGFLGTLAVEASNARVCCGSWSP